MTPYRRHFLAAGLAAAAASFVAVSHAQTTPPDAAGTTQAMPHHGSPEQNRAKMEQRMEKRLASLKQKLAITAAQDGAWGTWTAAIKPTPHPRPDRAEFKNLSTPERIDRMRAMRTQREAEMDKRMDATKTFYAALTPEQQKIFDKESMHMMGRPGDHGGPKGHHRG